MDEQWELFNLTEDNAVVGACLRRALACADEAEGLDALLSSLGTYYDCQRAYIFELVREGRLCNTYEWCAPGITAEKEHFQYASWRIVERWHSAFMNGEAIVIEDTESVKALDVKEYNWLKIQGVQTAVACPLMEGDQLLGFIGVNNIGKAQPGQVMPYLMTLAACVVQIMKRRDRMLSLEFMSYHDSLTGVLNRYALDKTVASQRVGGRSLGLVFCDISGLKHVNDIQGHIQGDTIILNVSQLLSEHFSGENVYRIGGDEFLALCFDISEADFREKAGLVRAGIPKIGTHLAMGAIWSPNGSADIKSMVLQAEEQMYTDKRNYYLCKSQSGDCPRDTPLCLKLVDFEEDRETPFQTFIHHNYFDAEAFFRSVAIPEAPYYLYFGDLQTNLYYISDNMRADFGFPGNVVFDLIEKWGSLIKDPQERALYHQDLAQIMEQKKDVHSLRYRITDKSGYSTWVHCRGIVKWSPDRTTPLFFSGCVSRLESNFTLDTVTGLLGERAALNELSILEAKENSAIIIGFGLNNFTYINESKGRLVGDKILRDICNTLLTELGCQYAFYRLDGIRFMAVEKQKNTYDAAESVSRIRRIIENQYSRQRVSTKQAAAFGVLHFPRDGKLPQELLENAITLINVARLNPELEFSEFSQDIISRQRDKSIMALSLSESVAQGCKDFRIVVQPIVDCVSGRIIGGETLLRWRYNGQDVSPAVFIPLLEASRMILTVGKWVFEQVVRVCRQITRIRPDFLLSFNVSYLQVLDDTFLPFMRQTLEENDLPGTCLMLELTENHFDEMPERLQQFVGECLKMGIKFALDDFGNGFSSLQLLLKYPVNVIKLDRTLMNELTHSNENLDFIMSIVYACHRSGKQVCVEGVETDEELAAVRQTDCDMIQGFYFYRPQELTDLFRSLK